MTRDQLTAEFRTITQDRVAPYLFADVSVWQWLDDAQAEAAVRGRLLHDSDNEAVCMVDVEAGTSVYPLHAALYEISHCAFKLAGASRREPVRLVSTEELDRTVTDWRDLSGTPRYAVQGDESIRLVPRPSAAGALLLEGYRLPLKSLAISSTAKPEIHAAHHRHLVHWALHRAFSLPDAETLDLGRADVAERAFATYFGLRPDSDLRRSTREDEAHTNKAFFP
jgi:hypothetical protein